MAKKALGVKIIITVLAILTGYACAVEQTPAPGQTDKEKIQPAAAVKSESAAPPKAETTASNAFSDKCAFILKEFVNDKGMVNYKMLKKKKLELTKVLDGLRSLDPNEYNKWPREDKIAFWLNAYNLEMLKIIVENYPIESTRMLRIIWPPDSIRHIKGIWDEYKFIIMEEEFTLQEIDQRFFREEFNEPRAFLAITHASLSSPPLRNEPYYGYKLNEQLDDQARKFLSNPLAFKIDMEKQKIYLSSIFATSWYGQYFVNKYGTDKKFKEQPPPVRAVLNFITHYTPATDVHYLETANYSVEYINYNWRLNE